MFTLLKACAKCEEPFGGRLFLKCEGSADPHGKSLLVEGHPLDDNIVQGPITANIPLYAIEYI